MKTRNILVVSEREAKTYQRAAQASGFRTHSLARRACRLVNSHLPLAFLIGLTCALASGSRGDDHHHDHGAESIEPVQRPKVFLDKSPRVVWYQLNRLENERLLLVERGVDDAMYAPVHTAILIRPGMSRQHREDAVLGLVQINKSNPVGELIKAMAELDESERQQQRVGRELAALLLQQPGELLGKKAKELQDATKSKSRALRASGFGGLIVAGKADLAWELAQASQAANIDYLNSIVLVPDPRTRASLRESVVASLEDSQPESVRRAAVRALSAVPAKPTENFRLVAPLVSDAAFRTVAVRTLLRISKKFRDADTAKSLVSVLVKHAESTPAADRTTDEFVEAMQLADQLMSLVPAELARSYRQRLREVTVRVVLIHTVEEEMRYDTPYFAVEAGRPVQVVLKNEDLMPHNLVITDVGSMISEIADEGAIIGPSPSGDGKPYVPKMEQVLFATNMVQPSRQERLTFTAPREPGEYPYVCTFPRHWMRMYGVMVVVEDLDEWLKNPVKPADPIGNTREFVNNWAIDDFKAELATELRGSPEIGKRIFEEATCAQCHKFADKGGAVGPELTDIWKRWKGDSHGVLREVLDPSHKIEPKYAVHIVVTLQGKVISGIVKAEDQDAITILDNPENPKPSVIKQDDIDDIVKSPKSMMPKALLDRFTKDEILELLAYLKSGSEK